MAPVHQRPNPLARLKAKKKPADYPLKKWLLNMADIHGRMMTMDGYDDCIAGVAVRAGQDAIVVYDQAKVIAKLMKDGMTREDAVEFHEFNQVGSWFGPRTPAFLIAPP